MIYLPRSALWFIVIAGVIFLQATSNAHDESWLRFITSADVAHRMIGVPFIIAETGNTPDSRLSAAGWYRYTQGKSPLVLHGKKQPDGLFCPNLSYEVAVNGHSEWKKFSASDIGEPGTETVTVSPKNPILKVRLEMEPFRGLIGVYRYGRVVLENGDSAIIALEDLLPTANARGADGAFKQDVTGMGARIGYEAPRPDDPAVLSQVVSLGGNLIGEFLFDARGKVISLVGTRTSDGDFWPMVKFEVGNSNNDWKEIGQSRNEGVSTDLQVANEKAKKIRVLLSDYVPWIGKYKFGKITFSDGESSSFYLDLLDPNENHYH